VKAGRALVGSAIYLRFMVGKSRLLHSEISCKQNIFISVLARNFMTTRRYCFALDLKSDPLKIAEYIGWHKPESARPEITESIRNAGIENMEIYITGNRLLMVVDGNEGFDPKQKAESDKTNPIVMAWEELMSNYQQPLPWAAAGEKWVKMDLIYSLPFAECEDPKKN
jgi:L-rhamnose mutarotase